MHQGTSTLDVRPGSQRTPCSRLCLQRRHVGSLMQAVWGRIPTMETLKHHHLILLPGRTQRLLCSQVPDKDDEPGREQGAWPPTQLQGDPGGRLWSLPAVARAPGGHWPRQVCSRRGPAPSPSIRPLIFQHPLASRRRDGWAPGPADRCEITQRPDRP